MQGNHISIEKQFLSPPRHVALAFMPACKTVNVLVQGSSLARDMDFSSYLADSRWSLVRPSLGGGYY